MKEYSFREFELHLKGHQFREAVEWDRARHIMFVVAKSAGSKKIKGVKDIMEIPLLDAKTGTISDERVRKHREIQERLRLRKRLHEVNSKNAAAT